MRTPAIRGVTLIELMIYVTIAGAVLAVGAIAFGRCVPAGNEAETAARSWAQQMGYEVQGVSCVSYDTDGDGYVSCSLVSKAKPEQPIALECAGRMTMNSGCRLQKPATNR